MHILNVNEVAENSSTTAMVYGFPGSGKTTALSWLPGSTLIIDVDSGTRVLADAADRCASKVTIWRIDDVMADIPEILHKLECKCDFDYVCIDSISELERQILSALGKSGKNNGVPEIQHYQQCQFKLADLCRRMRALPANFVMTAWEVSRDVMFSDGSKYSQQQPLLQEKTVNNICGLCDLVGEVFADPKSNDRFVRLSASPSLIAKDRIWKRPGCRVENFLNPKKEEVVND